MVDSMENALIAGLTWIGGSLGLELFDMLVLLAAISGTWLFLLRARMYVGLAQSRKRHQRKQRRPQDQKQQQATADAAKADADDADDPPLLRSHPPNVHRVAVQPPTAPGDTDRGAAADAGDPHAALWLNRTGPVSDPQPVLAHHGADDADPADADPDNAMTVIDVVATGDRLLDLL